MPTKTKLEHYTELLQNSVNGLSTPEKWLPFLETSSRIYKYKFKDKVMIHAQRPNATACADYDLWRRKDVADRQVMRGSKGIALLDDKGNGANLKYVFDVADTEARSMNSDKKLFLWQINDNNTDVIADMLKTRYGADSEGLDNALIDTAKALVNEYGGDYANELIDYTEGTFLEELDDYNVWVQFSELLENSIAYTLLERCGYKAAKYFDLDDFKNIRDFNGIGAITVLGRAMSELSEQALRDIEKTVKLERGKQHEHSTSKNIDRGTPERRGTDLHVGRSDTDLSPEPNAADTADVGAIRQDEVDVSEGTQTDPVRNSANQRDVDGSLDGNRQDGAGAGGTVDTGNGESGRGERETQSREPNAVGRADEQHQTPSDGNNSERTDLQLNTAEPHQIVFTKVGDFYECYGDNAKILSEIGGTTLTSRNGVDMCGIPSHALEQYSEMLKEAGYSVEINEIKQETNLEIPREHLEKILKYDWHMNVRKPEILEYFLEHNEPKERAEFMKAAYNVDSTGVEVDGVIYTYQKTADALVISSDDITVNISWADVQAHVADLIAKHEYLSIENPVVVDNTPTVESSQLSLFGEEIDVEKPVTKGFSEIDEQIIKAELMRGSGFQDGKFRIEEYAKTSPTTAEFADFLKNEYGTGGGSGYGDYVNSQAHDYKGIHLELSDGRKLDISYNNAAKRIAELVKNGEYITENDISERIEHAEYILNNYNPDKETELREIEKAEKILEMYGMFEEDSADIDETAELSQVAETPKKSEVEDVPVPVETAEFSVEDYLFKVGDILELDKGIFEVVHVADGVVKLWDTAFDDLLTITEDELYNQGFSVIEQISEKGEKPVVKPIDEVSEPEEIDPLSLIGKHYTIDGRDFVVENINVEWNDVSFRDVTFQNGVGFPIFRKENIDFLLYIEREEREKAVEPEPDITDLAVEEPEELENTEILAPAPEPIIETPKPRKYNSEAKNFRITDDNLGVDAAKLKTGFSAKEKFNNNIAAIKLLKEIEGDFERIPTPEEQTVLSRYVGWGGLAQAFDENNSSWSDEYLTLKNTLSDYEYDSARESTLNAHYTSPTVIKAIYEGLENLGFKSGNVLEPSMGVGNFMGLIPESMNQSKLYGVELDDISGRIAKQLYPNAQIKANRGFEETHYSDNFFDIAVGNVPFGGYKVPDKRYDKLNLNIHDYFFAKALDKVRPGGVVAFVTSKGTLDKQNSRFREYLAERADLLGAIRLPNNAFKANAGTEVTSDIIFLQKRDSVMEVIPEWVKTERNSNGILINKYFIDNPDMLLGAMAKDNMMYGNENETTCNPIEGAVLSEQLKTAIANIQGNIPEYEHDEDEKVIDSIPADESVKNYSFTLVDDKIYYRENSRMNRIEYPKATEERIKAMIELRDCVRTLIDLQLNEYGESDILNQQFKLNTLYDKFNKKFGLINSSANRNAFKEDNSYYLLSSLEVLDEQGALERKADMFTKRTINQCKVVTSVDTASEALAVSIAEKARVDLDFMSELSSISKEQIIDDLQGVIYKMPLSGDVEKYVTADEYLSGDIREKLKIAKEYHDIKGGFETNIRALEQVMPKPLEASDIDVRLGVNWIEPEYIKQFICETLQTSYHAQRLLNVKYFDYTAEWSVEGKNADHSNVLAYMKFGTGRKNAYSIIEDSLNLRDVRVFDYETQPDGSKRAVLNKKETMLAQEKQEVLKQAFKDWIFKAPDRRQYLVEKYNVMFNSTRPREYDGSHITFSGMNPEITLEQHQRNAVAHALYGGNTLFAHVVGAGKTYEMVAAAMESKRLGLCNKSMIVVPNHITEQFGSDFLKLYPSANILVATKKDFETKNRRRLCAKIATGDYDAVIIGHSQLEKIPISPERQQRLLEKQIRDITNGISAIKHQRGERFTIKQLEKTKKTLQARLKKLMEAPRRDDVVTFEELGVDKLIIDESHGFKNLFLHTKMRNVAGVQTTEAQKSTDLYLKCQYLDEKTGGKGIIHATGTPISNSMSEMYTVMRYLQADMLRKQRLEHFDSWAAQFGETTTAMELAPEGGGYRARTRFAKFFNLPELMNLFKECADIKTADMLNLPVPEVTFHNVVAQPTEHQKAMVAELSERAVAVQQKKVEPNVDNMLCITNDGRKIGLDQRLLNPLLPDEDGTKVNLCVDNVHRIYEETSPQKSTQLIFCDFSTPKNDGKFNVYDDIRKKLMERGVPKSEIAFIHEYDSEDKKKSLFSQVRKGQVRVLLGSTAKMGSGTNVQDKLIALHDLDAPWRPADLEQRLGRIKRQGNSNPHVDVFRYVTENTFDAYLYQTLENKQKYISQIMTSKSPVRSMEDIDETTLSYAEVKALCAGNPLIKEKIDLEVVVARLKTLKSNHNNEQYRLEDNVLKYFPESIKKMENCIKGYESDCEHLKTLAVPADVKMPPMTIMGTEYTDKEAAGKALIEACKSLKSKEKVDIGSYNGFDMLLSYDSFSKNFYLELKREMTYSTTLGADSNGNIIRVNNLLERPEVQLKYCRSQLDDLTAQLETAKAELGKPFPREEELTTKIARLAELNIQLNIEGKKEVIAVDEPIAADKPPTNIDKVADKLPAIADKPPKSIYGKMKYYKDKANPPKETDGIKPKSRSETEL